MSCYVTGLVPNQYLAQIHFQNMTPVEQNPFTYSNLTNDHLILQVADFSEINKRVGHNKAMQEGFFSHLYRRKSGFKGKISKINKCGGPNKVVQVLIRLCRKDFFLIYVGENQVLKEKYQKLIKVQVLIRLCRWFFSRKIIRFAA